MARTGRVWTFESRAKAAASRAAWWTPERRAAFSEKQRGNKHSLGLVRAPFTEEHRANLWKNRDRAMSEEQKLKIAAVHRGRKRPESTRRALSAAKMGALNPNWKGGCKAEDRMIRERVETKLWREAVFARDNHTCGMCLVRGGSLEAHHIAPVKLYPGKRYDVGNGVALCKKCHRYVTMLHHRTGIYRVGAEASALQSTE